MLKQCKQYHKENREQRLEWFKQYQKENKEQISKRKKQYYEENKEKIKEYDKQYYEKNKELYIEYRKQYYEENKEKILEKRKQYCEENKEQIKEYKKQYEKKRRETDMGYRILDACRKRLYKAIKRNTKSVSTKKLIGCSIEHLLQHLENQFTKGMTWDNYGEWHIDHIKPCAMFDFTKEEDQRECFHYTNLQPLWAEDNLRKSDKYIEEDEQLSIAI